MATRDRLEELGDDPFNFIGRTARPEPTPELEAEPEPEPPVEPTKQISVRLPLSLYRRWKLALMTDEETQESVLNRLIEEELDRRGA